MGRRTGAGGSGEGRVTLRVKTLGMTLLTGAFLIGVGAMMIFNYQQRLMDFSIHEFVQKEVRAAAAGVAASLEEKGKLLRQVAYSDIALRYLESPSSRGPVYEGLLHDLRALVSSDPMINLAYVQSSTSYLYCCQSDGLPPDESYSPIGQPWYDLPVARKGLVVTPPYLEQGGESLNQMGKPMISMALPVYDGARKLLGVAALDLLLTPSQNLFSSIAPLKSGYFIVMAADGTVLSGPHASADGEPLRRLEQAGDYPVAAEVIASHEPALRLRDPDSGRWVWAGSGTVPVTGWRIVMVFPEARLAAEFGRFARELLWLGAVGVAVFSLLSVLFSSRISRMEAGVRAGRERYREMFDQAPVAACATDGGGRVTDASRAFLALTGAERSALIGARVEEIVYPEDAAKAGELIRRAGEEGSAADELRFMRADGEPVACDAAAAPLRGARPGVLIVARDSAQERRRSRRIGEMEAEIAELNRIMVQREFRVKELRDRVRESEKGAGGGSG
ncbi:MAG: PAS domain S-box protein [Chlamydiota bacterium]